jgi:DNA polymerase-1
VHDELVFEVPEEQAEEVRAAVVEGMVAAFAMEPPLGVDAGVGPDWLSAK